MHHKNFGKLTSGELTVRSYFAGSKVASLPKSKVIMKKNEGFFGRRTDFDTRIEAFICLFSQPDTLHFCLARIWRPSVAIGPPPRLQRPSAPRSAATPSRGTASVRVGSAPSLPHRLEVPQQIAVPTIRVPEAVLVMPYRCSMQSQACTIPTSLDPRHLSSAARHTGELDN